MRAMKLLSVNTGLPRDVLWQGRTVTTAIFKEPVRGPVTLFRHNLAGEGQADLTVQGGRFKAVYCYPFEHYEFWKRELNRDLTPAAFGENFTTEGLLEDSIHLGDELAVGSAKLVVTQPRVPCFKLGLRFQS